MSQKTLNEMMEAVAAFNAARDWGRYHSPRNLAMALSVEANELLELFLWSTDAGPQPALPEREEKVPDEIADVLITLLNLCARCGIDPVEAFERKLAANAQRYPAEKVRGSMRKYSEYSDD